MKSPRDHEVRAYFHAEDYSRIVALAGRQDRSIANFTEHAVRRYMALLEEQDEARRTRESIPALRRKTDDF